MNFLIFDHDLCSVPLIKLLLDDFHYVTLVTTNPSGASSFSSNFLSVQSGDVTNASEVLESLMKHENDPFDAVLIFNLSLFTGLKNVFEALHRLENQRPPVFFFYVNRPFESNKEIDKTLKDSAESIRWTVIISPQIENSTETNYHVEKKIQSTSKQTISSMAIVEFLRHELQKKENQHQIISLH